MITEEEIRRQADRRYPDFLRSLVMGDAFFPLDIRFGKRGPKGDYHGFAKKRMALLSEAGEVIAAGDSAEGDVTPAGTADGIRDGSYTVGGSPQGTGYVVELERHNSRRYGLQMLPTRIYFDDEAGYTGFLSRTREVSRFRAALWETRQRLPELLPWILKNVTRVVQCLDHWSDVLSVARYIVDHPQPNLYVRELPLPIHTKFIEENAGLLSDLLRFLLPDDRVDLTTTDFARRFGLRYDEPLVRLRALDPMLDLAAAWPAEDLSMPVSAVAGLDAAGSTVVIAENKLTFLTLPRSDGGLGIWGGGFRIEVLRSVEWLPHCRVFYWGDLDAQGFVILSRLRSFVPDARSVMMDVETFEAFREFAVAGTPENENAAPNLTAAEADVFRSLARTNLRLEQERIPHAYGMERFAQVIA